MRSLNGPAHPAPVQDLFTPEINSGAPTLRQASVERRTTALSPDSYDPVQRQRSNEINGFHFRPQRHDERQDAGVDSGMNFQTVSTAERASGRTTRRLPQRWCTPVRCSPPLDFINTGDG
jgi:hypothetical protein